MNDGEVRHNPEAQTMKTSHSEAVKTGTMPCAALPSPRSAWQRLLVPVDFSPQSREALKVAVALAADPEDRITLLHVIEPDPFLQRGNEVMMLLRRSEAELVAEAEARLRRWAELEGGPDIVFDLLVRSGRVDREILRVAERQRSDVIVLAAGERTWLERFCFGSIGRQLARLASCTVLTVRAPRPSNTIPVAFGADPRWTAQAPRERGDAGLADAS
jgi:CPA2 family monovalent cation:H+ antiporter-2